MKLFQLSSLTAVALGYGKYKDMYNCDFDNEYEPVVSAFSLVTNQLGPKVITNIFLESGSDRNVIISPVAMTSQLTILHEGAGGDTKTELEKLTLLPEHGSLQAMAEIQNRYECITKGKIQAKNAMFLDKSFQPKPDFVNRVQMTKSNIFKMNFAEQPELSRSIIDTWAATQSGVKDIELPEDTITKETSMLLLSSVHFEAKWAVKFEASLPGGFLLGDGKTKIVETMELQTIFPYVLSCNDSPIKPTGCLEDDLVPSTINIPLEDPRLQITVLLPNEKLPIAQILAMSSQWMPYWRFLSENNYSMVKLRLPKVEVHTQLDLTNALFGVGVSTAFEPFYANFTGITEDVGISASNIFQRNFLTWDLDGATAGADIVSSLKSGLKQRGSIEEEALVTEFNVDRGFVFVISDKTTQSNLFMGVINDPRS